MKRIELSETMLSNDNIFKSLIENEIDDTVSSAENEKDMFDTVFADIDEDTNFNKLIKPLDADIAVAVQNQMEDPKDVKIVVKRDEDGEKEAFITVEEFANFCKFSGLSVKEAAEKICDECDEEEIPDDKLNIVVHSGLDTASTDATSQFVKCVISNGLNVCSNVTPPTEEAVTEGSWSNSTDIDKEKKWYKEFLARVSKNNSESDEEVKARISALKTCVARMEKCLDDFKKYKNGKGPLKGDSFKDHAEWSFKYIVPTSVFYRLAKYPKVGIGELVLKIGNLATMILGTAGMIALSDYFKINFNVNPVVPVVIGANLYGIERDYENMLTTQIKETNNAIEYLESTLKQKD